MFAHKLILNYVESMFDLVKINACGCTHDCMLRMLLLFLLRLMIVANCMTTLGLSSVRF